MNQSQAATTLTNTGLWLNRDAGSTWFADALESTLEDYGIGGNWSILFDAVISGMRLSTASGESFTAINDSGRDLIFSNELNTTLAGGRGNDIYVYVRGNGHDTIVESSNQGNNDQLVFFDIASTEVTLVREGMHLRILIPESTEGAGDEGSVLLRHQFESRWDFGVERLHFADGVSWTQANLREMIIEQDRQSGETEIIGFRAADVIRSTEGDNILRGMERNDTYIYARGNGHDTIIESSNQGNNDQLIFEDIVSTEVTLVREGMHLRILIPESTEGAGDEGSVFLRHHFEGRWGFGVETVHFADGVSWTQSQAAALLNPTGIGPLTHRGFNGDDTFISSGANEVFFGGGGDDTFVFAPGFGHDAIISFSTGAGSDDTIVFYEGVFTDLDAVITAATQQGDDVLITVDDDNSLLLKGVLLSQLHADDFSFVDMAGNPLELAGGPVVLEGTAGDDVLVGASGADNHILGGGGDDFLYGVGGNNILDGGTGNDFMRSGSGQDTFVFRLGDGQNVIENFDITQDRIALDGIDPSDLSLNSFSSGTQLVAGDGTEFWFIGMTGVALSDLSFVDMEGEPLSTTEPLIVITGTSGDDTLVGSSTQNNHIIGGAGDDYLFGAGGDNLLDGGTGNDFMTSGPGQDTFVFRFGDGQNVIENFDITQDRIALDDLDEEDLTLTDYGSGSALVAADGTEFWFIGLTGVNRSDLSFVNYDQVA